MAIQLHFTKLWKLRFISGIVVIALACFLTGAECKRSACWRYGHVCWGGHGKRSGQPPVRPLDSTENDGGNPYPQRYPQSPQWEMNAKQFQFQHQLPPIISNGPMNRQNFHSRDAAAAINYQLSPAVYTLRPELLQSRSYYSPMPYQAVPIMLRQNDRQVDQHPTTDLGRNGQDDEGFNNSDYVVAPTDSSEVLAASPVHQYSTALKRSADGNQVGTNNASPTGRSTEEPLVTSANGQDSVSGPMSTFFRDRKSPAKSVPNSLEKERYLKNGDLTAASPGRLHPNIYQFLPMAQLKGKSHPNKRYYY